MEDSNSLPVDLQTIGRRGDLIKITKIESPIGVVLHKSLHEIGVNSTPRKKTSSKIKLAQPIVVGEQVIKICKKKGSKDEKKVKREYYATLSAIVKIECVEIENIFAYTRNCKYKIIFL